MGSSVGAFVGSESAQKVQIDVSGMLNQVDFSTVIAGIIAAGGVLIGPRIAKMGIRFILGLFEIIIRGLISLFLWISYVMGFSLFSTGCNMRLGCGNWIKRLIILSLILNILYFPYQVYTTLHLLFELLLKFFERVIARRAAVSIAGEAAANMLLF